MNTSSARLGDVADFVNGVAFKTSDWDESGSHKIIRIQNLTDSEKPFNRTNRKVTEKNIATRGDIWSRGLELWVYFGGTIATR